MKQMIARHPLLFVVLIAIALRLPAVCFSKGYMASDDHFETIRTAFNWLRTTPIAEDGLRMWKHRPADEHARFALYDLFLYGQMKLMVTFGIRSLDTMMYFIRAVHALMSLLSVWAAFATVRIVTRSEGWAMVAGLMVAGHFAMPFLSVRNLIEMVGGHLWAVTIYLFYKYQEVERKDTTIVLAGIFTGLAWMIRFPIALAVLPIPLILWFSQHDQSYRRAAIVYSATVGGMIALCGLADYFLTGSFGSTTINQLAGFFKRGEAMYNTIFLIYPAVLLAFFIPPFSLVAFSMIAARQMFRRHKLLILSCLSFLLLHSILTNRQERFMIPIVPVLMILLTLALYHHYQSGGWFFRKRWLAGSVIGFTIVINFLLIGPFTFNYGHKGLVDPLVRLERMVDHVRVMFVSPDQSHIYPYNYGGLKPMRRGHIKKWDDLRQFIDKPSTASEFDFFVLLPLGSEQVPAYVDSLTRRIGNLELVMHVGPSAIDYMLHKMNPKHNPTREAWVYRKALVSSGK
ncbi:MAG: glycosyltransferase family 39 protein [candidate division Zixibacteria bacterium]